MAEEVVFAVELESVSWRRPGTLELVVSRRYIVGVNEPRRVGWEDVYKTEGTLEFVENEVKYEGRVDLPKVVGRVARLTTRWRGARSFGSPTALEPEREKERWSVNFTVSERDIVLHPNFAKIQAAGWGRVYGEKVLWPRMIYVKNEERGEGGEEYVPVKNPMYGVRSYLAPRVEVTLEEFVTKRSDVSGEVLDRIGWYAQPPGRVPRFMAGPDVETLDFVLTGENAQRGRDGVRRRTWMYDPAMKRPVYTKPK